MKILKKIVIIFLTIIIVLAGIIAIYLNTGIYKAEEEALKYLNSTDQVKVTKIDEGYFFDGPGENTAIVFYPGAKVEYTAYSKLMYKIAESGKDCFLVKMPVNMAIFGVFKAQNIMEKYDYENWYLSGHSMGGAMACVSTSDKPNKIKGVITLAAYPTKTLPNNIKYISIYGSEDKVLNMQRYNNAKQYLPENNEAYIIEGGNHASFANYGKQKGDGEASITGDKQLNEVINVFSEI